MRAQSSSRKRQARHLQVVATKKKKTDRQPNNTSQSPIICTFPVDATAIVAMAQIGVLHEITNLAASASVLLSFDDSCVSHQVPLQKRCEVLTCVMHVEAVVFLARLKHCGLQPKARAACATRQMTARVCGTGCCIPNDLNDRQHPLAGPCPRDPVFGGIPLERQLGAPQS